MTYRSARPHRVRPNRAVPAAVALLLVATTAACGRAAAADTKPGSSSTAEAPAAQTGHAHTVRFEVKDGRLVTGPRSLDVRLGEQVVVEVVSTAADELHVHGYDREAPVEPGKTAQVSFTADLPGVFDVELHGSDLKLCELRVQ
jgi:hypothetical protein